MVVVEDCGAVVWVGEEEAAEYKKSTAFCMMVILETITALIILKKRTRLISIVSNPFNLWLNYFYSLKCDQKFLVKIICQMIVLGSVLPP